MTTVQKFGQAAVFVLLISAFTSSPAQAQRMGGRAMGRAPVQMAHAQPVTRAGGFGAAFTGTRPTNAGFFYAPSFRVPGVSSTSRTRGTFGVSAATRRRVRFRRPIAGSGFYLLDGGYLIPEEPSIADRESQPEQLSAEAQQNYPEQDELPPPPAQASVPAQTEAAPLTDVGQFTLVLRSGAKIQAVGFTRVSDKIVYITADGSRRTIATADLDAAATRQVNEDSGTPVLLSL